MRDLKDLRELDLRFNQLHDVSLLDGLSKLEQLYCGNNSITSFPTIAGNLQYLHMIKNPLSRFSSTSMPSLTITYLNLSSARLASLPTSLFDCTVHLEQLILDNNEFTSIPELGKLKNLQHLSCCNNQLNLLPPELGQLRNITAIDVHDNNLKTLPDEIWFLHNLTSLNASSNLITTFPKMPPSGSSISSTSSTIVTDGEKPGNRRDSSWVLNKPGTPFSALDLTRRESVASNFTFSSSHQVSTMSQSLRILSLGDNRLNQDCFEEIQVLIELRVLNLSYNELAEVPLLALSRLSKLSELYLSGNELTTLPSDDLDRLSTLRVIHVNGNKLQTIPAEIGNIKKLHVFDVSCNQLKYNIANWPYDWNWNWNLELKYLGLSGNKRLEIKPSVVAARGERNLADFSALHSLRNLGLIDVTLTIPSVPEDAEDCRVRTVGSETNALAYGIADTLGRYEHLSITDRAISQFQGSETRSLYMVFDGQPKPNGGNRVANYLRNHFHTKFAQHLELFKEKRNPVEFALRRTYLDLNRDIGSLINPNVATRVIQGTKATQQEQSQLTPEDIKYGATALTVYIDNKTMYIANCGNTMAVLSHAGGEAKLLSKKHIPGDIDEAIRIRASSGSVSRNGKISTLDVSRSFGYTNLMPTITAAPHIEKVELTEQDEFVILANRELWEYMSYQTAVDIARTERDDVMRAAQKLRDFAIAYGARSKIVVIIVRVQDRFRKQSKTYSRHASQSLTGSRDNLSPEDDISMNMFKKRRGRDELPQDSVC